MNDIINITSRLTARQIAADPRKHFENLAHSLLDEMLPLITAGHITLAARVEAAAEEALRLSRAQILDADQLRAFAADCHQLAEEAAVLQARLEGELAL
jgi:hypothetical protein